MNIAQLLTTHRKLLLVGALVLLVIFVLTFPLYGGDYNIRVLTTMLVYAILAVSWVMFSGATGYMSLAPAAFFGTGIYIMALLQHLLPFPVIIVIGGLVSFALAILLGLVTLRLKGIYFTIFTFGLVMFIGNIVNFVEAEMIGRHGWYFLLLDRTMLLYTMLGLAVVTVLAIYFIGRSRLGLAMRSIGGNEEAAEHMGINTTRVKVLTFAISAIFMGAAGVVVAPSLSYSNPGIAFSVTYSFIPIVAAVFGGMGSLPGPIVGGLIFGFLEKTLRATLLTYFMIVFGVIMVVVILFLPNGIAALGQGWGTKLWTRLTEPLPESGKEKTWKPTAAGILSIIAGIVQVGGGIAFAVNSMFLAQFTGMEFIGGFIGWFAGLYTALAALLIISGLIALLGSICALRRRIWGLALAGSICALPSFIFGIPAIIFVILSKGEFEYGTEGGQIEQHANT